MPRSMPCFRYIQCLDSRPIPISSQFLLFLHMPSVLKMYWVALTADCRNSVCRNRVCRNSVCLPRQGDTIHCTGCTGSALDCRRFSSMHRMAPTSCSNARVVSVIATMERMTQGSVSECRTAGPSRGGGESFPGPRHLGGPAIAQKY